jgi:hypothetical protein
MQAQIWPKLGREAARFERRDAHDTGASSGDPIGHESKRDPVAKSSEA